MADPAVAAGGAADEAADAVAEGVIAAAGSEAEDVLIAANAAGLGEEARQADLARDILGNPFRPIAFDPSWRIPDVTALARAAYEDRILPKGELDPQRLAVLADALEEVGASEEVVAHLRSPEPHVRGCHVVDYCLGKS